MKTKIAIVGVIAVCGLAGCERKSVNTSLPSLALASAPSSIATPEPGAAAGEAKKSAEPKPAEPQQTVEAETTPEPPASPVEREQQYADPVASSTVWQIVNESTDWSGKWVRQGNSDVFDSYITNKWNGENRHHIIKVEVNGNVVTASHDDGTTYRGEISADRAQIQGVQMWNGRTGNWIARIDMTSLRAPAQPPKPRPAPEGVYFLLKSVSITTDAGIVGLHPGTELHLLRDDGPTLHVNFGDAELDVNKTAVTNDLNAAETAYANDREAQASLAEWGKAQAAISEQQEAAKQKEVQQQRMAVEQGRTNGSVRRVRSSSASSEREMSGQTEGSQNVQSAPVNPPTQANGTRSFYHENSLKQEISILKQQQMGQGHYDKDRQQLIDAKQAELNSAEKR